MLGRRISAGNGSDHHSAKTLVLRDPEGLRPKGSDADGLFNLHSHSFTLKHRLTKRVWRDDNVADRPRSDLTYKWSKIIKLNTKTTNKSEKTAKLAAILSENVTDFLLFNVLDKEIYELSLVAVALSWGDVASGVLSLIHI